MSAIRWRMGFRWGEEIGYLSRSRDATIPRGEEPSRRRHQPAAGRRRDVPTRPGHGHFLADDIAKAADPGYSYVGRLKGLAELRGVMRALRR
jgi:hypothetical protein